MNKYFMLTALFSTIIMGCGSSTTEGCTTYECIDKLNGTAGADSTSVGGSSQTTSEVGGSSFVGPSSTGGSSIVGSTVGGTSAVGAGGASIAATTKTCIPRTCEDIAAAAAVKNPNFSKPIACDNLSIDGETYTSDNCGGKLKCGSCDSDLIGTPNIGCGKAPTTPANVDYAFPESTPNICGSRCFNTTDPRSTNYVSCETGKSGWRCPSEIPPSGLTGCTIINSIAHSWCCDS